MPVAVPDLEPNYEELKQNLFSATAFSFLYLEPNYEELKPLEIISSSSASDINLEPNYEELKQVCVRFPLLSSFYLEPNYEELKPHKESFYSLIFYI